MTVRIRFSNTIPFPDKPGIWMRLVIGGSPKGDGHVVVTQGHVMNFMDENVVLLHDKSVATLDAIKGGDDLNVADGLHVAYVQLTAIDIARTSTTNTRDIEIAGG